MKRVLACLVIATTLALLGGCGKERAPAVAVEHRAPNGAHYNDADALFARQMTQHDAQALVLVDLTDRRPLDLGIQELATRIRDREAPEVERLVGWLAAWGKPEPPTDRDHAHADQGEHVNMAGIPGALSKVDLNRLRTSAGEDYQTLWLQLMIRHHKGALKLAQKEISGGLFRPMVQLARDIRRAQQDDLELLRRFT